MHVTEILFILSAGALTLLSPCGYPLFLAYLSYYIGSKIPLKKVLGGGSVAAVGFLTVFVVIGLAPALLGEMVLHYVPILEVVAGLIVIAFGVVALFGAKLPIRMPSLGPTTRSGLSGLFIFGLAFGMATAACSAPIFLTIILLAMTSGGILDVVFTFLVYAVGMGVPVVISGLLVATAREAVLKRLVRMRPWLDKISGALMILIGIYLIYYYLDTYWL
jgi:cytochrome c biogenesis protein CcdA